MLTNCLYFLRPVHDLERGKLCPDLKGTFLSPKWGRDKNCEAREAYATTGTWEFIFTPLSLSRNVKRGAACLSHHASPTMKRGNTAWKRAPSPLVPLPFQESHSAMATGGMETLK